MSKEAKRAGRKKQNAREAGSGRAGAPEDHVLDGRGHAGHLPRDVGLPAAPGLGEVLQDGAALVGLDALRHHVEDVVHHGGAQLKVVVRLDALLGHRLGDALGRAPLELAREQVAQPALEQRHHAAQEKEPHAPAGRPDAAARALAHGASVEAVVDKVLQVLAHADLAHQPVLVSVHAGELADVREDVLQPVGELVGVDVAEAVLHVRVDDELGEAEDLAAQVKGVAEARLLALLGGERLDGLQVEVVVEVEVVDVLAVDEQVEHVVALPADLQAGLHPVQVGRLEELGLAERLEEVLLLEPLWRLLVQLRDDEALEQLLVGDAHLDRVGGRAVLLEPVGDERHVDAAARVARAHVEGARRPDERNGRRRVLRLDLLRQHVVEPVSEIVIREWSSLGSARGVRRDRVDHRIKVEGGQVGVLVLDVAGGADVVRWQPDVARARVVEEGEGELVLGADGLADDDLVNVVELVPVVVVAVEVAVERLKLGPAGDGHVEALGRDERVDVEEVEVVGVAQVGEQLRGEAVQVGHDRQRQRPPLVRGAVDKLGVEQRLGALVEPVDDALVLLLVELHLDRLERLDVQDVVAVVERRLLVVEGREAHPLEVAAVALLAPHHDPHGAPLRNVHRLDHRGHLVDKRDGAGDMVEHRHRPDLLPRHRHVLEQLEHRVRH
eukprot:4980259-Pleurochrysis_carterae.AAC.1